MVTCSNCCYYELTVIDIIPFEYCYKHNWTNRKPCDYAKNMELLEKENEQLQFRVLNENSILWNEIHILMEQGAEPSDAFKKYLESISTEYTKFWQRKLEKAKKDGVIE